MHSCSSVSTKSFLLRNFSSGSESLEIKQEPSNRESGRVRDLGAVPDGAVARSSLVLTEPGAKGHSGTPLDLAAGQATPEEALVVLEEEGVEVGGRVDVLPFRGCNHQNITC